MFLPISPKFMLVFVDKFDINYLIFPCYSLQFVLLYIPILTIIIYLKTRVKIVMYPLGLMF